jgi:MoxR-like ATPase
MTYPSLHDEKRMLATYNHPLPALQPIIGPEDLMRMQELAGEVHVAEDIFDYILALVAHTRAHRRVYLGASPRAALALLRAAKALALIRGRDYVLPDDIKALAALVLSHRIIMTPEAELEGVHGHIVVAEALERVAYKPSPKAR